MENEVVPYELALDLKELDFDEKTLMYYVGGNVLQKLESKTEHLYRERFTVTPAPLYQQAFRWFRDKGYNSGVYPYYDEFAYEIKDFVSENAYPITSTECVSYEEAQLGCLRKLIEIVKERSQKL